MYLLPCSRKISNLLLIIELNCLSVKIISKCLNYIKYLLCFLDATATKCSIAADVVFILDSSASMKPDYERQKLLVQSILDQFHVGEGQIRIGFVVFGSYAKTHSDFDDVKSSSTAKAAVENVPFIGGHSRLDLALTKAHQLFEGTIF